MESKYRIGDYFWFDFKSNGKIDWFRIDVMGERFIYIIKKKGNLCYNIVI